KYVMFPDRQNNSPEPKYTINTGALGNAWFVSSVQLVANPDSAMVSLGNLDTRTNAVVEQTFANDISGSVNSDSNSSVKLLDYHPETLTYESNSTSGGFAVFSEIYYADGWNAYIDDKLVNHVCANYILRGLEIPAGKHKIEFKFEPKTYATGKMLSNTFSGLIYLLLIITIGLGIRKEMSSNSAE
ncbi:MAG: YfhO family protein, partial [Bacteroidia bacterium]|nr:YfhO family protein [Bacteroidia bacterium]